MEYVHTPIFYPCETCGTRTKTLEALSFHTERRHSLDSTDNPEIEENDHSKKIEELKVKLFLTRTIDGLQKSIVPNEELSKTCIHDGSKQTF